MHWILIALLTIILAVFLVVILICVIGLYDHHSLVANILDKAKQASTSTDPAISKQGFTHLKCAANSSYYDAIIIGSGIGGLTTAVLLARRGYKVLCLEQHDVVGGCTHSFKEKGFEFDTGLHYVGGDVGNRKSMVGYLFDTMSLGRLSWHKLDNIYDTARILPTLQKRISLPNDSINSFDYNGNDKSFVEKLNASFPGEEKNIREYMNLLGWAEIAMGVYATLKIFPLKIASRLSHAFSPFLKTFFSTTTKDVLASCTSNSSLAGCLAWCWGDYGLPPSDSAFILNCVLTSHFLHGGGHYPVGGPGRIAESMIPTVEAAGGKVYVRARVTQILLDESETRAIGVLIKGEPLYAPVIVSACGVLTTYGKLLPARNNGRISQIASDIREKLVVQQQEDDEDNSSDTPRQSCMPNLTTFQRLSSHTHLSASCAMFSVFVGLQGSPEEIKFPATNYWLYPSWDHDQACVTYANQNDELLAACKSHQPAGSGPAQAVAFPCVFISSPSAKDPDWSRRFPGKSVMEIVTVADYALFAASNTLDDAPEQGSANGLRSRTRSRSLSRHRSHRYSDLKARYQQQLLDIFTNEFPHLRDRIAYVSSGTPLTNNDYLGATQGEVYGLSHNVHRFSAAYEEVLRPEQQIKGLYLSGQDVLCNGICGAMAGGVLCAIAIDKTVVLDLATSYVLHYV